MKSNKKYHKTATGRKISAGTTSAGPRASRKSKAPKQSKKKAVRSRKKPELTTAVATAGSSDDAPQETVELYLRPDSFTALAFPMLPETANDDHSPLDDGENRLLTECEEQIGNGVKCSAAMAAAFFTIKAKRLYREAYRTFEDYCRRRWKFSRQHGYRIAKTGEIQTLASQYGYGVKNEFEARRLGRLSSDELKKVLQLATTQSNGQPITKGLLSEVQMQIEQERKQIVKHKATAGNPAGGAVPDLTTLISLEQILGWLDELLLASNVDANIHDRLEQIKNALALHAVESNKKAA
jgi:hypothetical protein